MSGYAKTVVTICELEKVCISRHQLVDKNLKFDLAFKHVGGCTI